MSEGIAAKERIQALETWLTGWSALHAEELVSIAMRRARAAAELVGISREKPAETSLVDFLLLSSLQISTIEPDGAAFSFSQLLQCPAATAILQSALCAAMMDLFSMPLISTGPFRHSPIAACAFETARAILDLSVSKSAAANEVRQAESTMALAGLPWRLKQLR